MDSKTGESYTVNSIDDNQYIPFTKPVITNNDINHIRSQEDTLTTRNWSNNENRDALSWYENKIKKSSFFFNRKSWHYE